MDDGKFSTKGRVDGFIEIKPMDQLILIKKMKSFKNAAINRKEFSKGWVTFFCHVISSMFEEQILLRGLQGYNLLLAIYFIFDGHDTNFT